MERLGQLTWYSIHDVEATRQEIVDRLDRSGLTRSFVPRPILPVDAFRRATSELETRRQPRQDGTFVNLLAREVAADRKEVVRHLVREVVDSDNQRLSYTEIAKIRLDKRMDGISIQSMVPLVDLESDALHEVSGRYARYLDTYQSRHLRELVLDILKTFLPVAVRPSGGVYFVPKERADDLDKLGTFVRSFSGSELWAVPVVDGGDTRRMIAHSVDRSVEDVAQRLVEQLRQTLARRGAVGLAEQRGAVEELQRLQTLTGRYEALLEEKMSTARANLEAAARQVRCLLEAAS